MNSSKYNLIKQIGQGQYGLIFLATPTNINQQHQLYAIKQIDNNQYDSQVMILPHIKHPNIIHVHEVLKQRSNMFVVFEYAKYGDLAKYVRLKYSEEYIPQKNIRSWLLQICLALYHLHHELNIIHRDIKTMNVFVTENELIKLGDFGLAKKNNSFDEFTKSAVGTPYYLSPQTISSSKSNNKSDIWALGCLLYQLCTGQKPFKGIGLSQIIKNILNDEIGQLPQCYSKWLSDLMRSLLQKNGQKRPTVQSILEDQEMRKQFAKLKSNHKEYESFIYPQISLRTTKYLQREQKFLGSMKLFSQSLKTTKKQKPIKLQMQEGFGQTSKLKQKKIEKTKFANQSLRFLLQRRKKQQQY